MDLWWVTPSANPPYNRCMSVDFPLRCRCGHVRGMATDVSAHAGFRFVCYCADCQAFARLLQRPDALDAAGGTDISHMPPARMALTGGTDAVRCLTFSGKVLRWYADCCHTPIANTASGPRFPVVALIHSFMAGDNNGRSRDETLGPPLCRIYERSATGPLPANASPPPSLRLYALRASRIFGWWAHRLGRPNPFFDVTTQAPLSKPRTFTSGERAAL